MENELTLQEALKRLLSEKKSRLNNGKELADDLKKYVSAEHFMDIGLYCDVLTRTNIGERLMAADKSDKATREQAKSDAVSLLQTKIYLPKDSALNVVDTLTEALGWNKKTAIDYYNDGIADLNNKKYDTALENFNQVIEMDSDYIEAYIQRGIVYKKQKNYKAAISDYSKVIELDSENSVAYRERGICYEKLENYRDALEDIEKAINMGCNDKDIREKQKFLNQKVQEGLSKVSDEESKPIESDSQKKIKNPVSSDPEPPNEPEKSSRIKEKPILTVGTFSKKGDTYEAIVDYNGDGELTPSIGVINDNILSVTSTDGNFKGVITASEGENYTAESVSFEHKFIKKRPLLHVGTFYKKDDSYKAVVTYNGDGELKPSIGVIIGNILSVPSVSGNFNGVIKASEGKNYTAESVPFRNKAKKIPILTVGTFSKSGDTYKAVVTYNGDGKLIPSIGVLNGNILSVTNTDGNFHGAINSFESEIYKAASVSFYHKSKTDIKKIPILTVGTFSKSGDTYKAIVTYNGDGKLKTSIGVINEKNILSITSTNGAFNGIIVASESSNYTEISTPFSYRTTESPVLKKVFWAVAGVAVIIAFSLLNDVMASKIKLETIQEQIQENEKQIEKYQNFLSEYGYVNESFYAEKAIVFMNKNSETRLSIYCGDLKDDIDIDDTDNLDVAMADWEDSTTDEKNKATVLISSEDEVGCSTIKFENNVTGDILNVLVVVQ